MSAFWSWQGAPAARAACALWSGHAGAAAGCCLKVRLSEWCARFGAEWRVLQGAAVRVVCTLERACCCCSCCRVPLQGAACGCAAVRDVCTLGWAC